MGEVGQDRKDRKGVRYWMLGAGSREKDDGREGIYDGF